MANGRSDGSVIIDTLVDTRGFGKGVNTMKRQMGGLTGAINKLGLAIAATFGISQLVKFGKSAIELGSDLEEVQNVVDVTFTSMSEDVNEFAKGAAEAAGLSETMAKKYVGTFGAMSKAFGFMEEEAFAMSSTLTQLVGDVASFYNLTQDEAYTKLKSVFTGETESLKDLGVVMTQSALDSFAMAKGYGKTTKAMSEQEKVSLRYAFVLEQLSAAQGDFIRTSDSWANQTRILSLNFDTFKANVGQALINIFTPFLRIINQLVSKLAQLSQYFVAFSELIVGKSTSGGGGSPGETQAAIAQGYEDIADATNKATKAQKNYVTGLDEIRTFAEKDTLSDISGGTGISGIQGNTTATKEEINNAVDVIENLEKRFPKLINFLRTSFDKIKEIFNDFKAGDFFAAGQDISQLVTGIYNFISEAIDSVEWDKLGEKIGDFIAGIEWIEIIKAALRLKINIWKAIAEVWIGAFRTAPFETAFISAIAAMRFLGLGNVLSNAIISAIPRTISAVRTINLTGITFSLSSIASNFSLGSMSGIGTPAFDVIGTWIWDRISDALNWALPDEIFNFLSNVGAGLVAGAVGGSWFPGAGTVAGAIIGAIVGALEGINIDGRSVLGHIGDSIFEGLQFIFQNTISEFEVSAYWFNKISEDFAEKDWLGIGQDVLMGIAHGLISFISIPIDPILRIFEWIWDGICNVFGIHSPAREMYPLGENILLGIVEGFRNTISTFTNTINSFWNQSILPFFNRTRWSNVTRGISEAFSNTWNSIKTGISYAWNGIVGAIKGKINEIIYFINMMIHGVTSGINNMISALNSVNFSIPNWIPGIGGESFGLNIGYVSAPYIPYLATGAVIPPNAPFMAVLGDQRHGTNIEAPLDTIKQAVREVIGNGGGGQYSFTAQINRRTLFEEFIEEAKLRQSTSGRNPFDLA